MSARYVVLPKADGDLDDEADYLVGEAGLEVGLRFLAAALETFDLLASQPEMGWKCRLKHPRSRAEACVGVAKASAGAISSTCLATSFTDLPHIASTVARTSSVASWPASVLELIQSPAYNFPKDQPDNS